MIEQFLGRPKSSWRQPRGSVQELFTRGQAVALTFYLVTLTGKVMGIFCGHCPREMLDHFSWDLKVPGHGFEAAARSRMTRGRGTMVPRPTVTIVRGHEGQGSPTAWVEILRPLPSLRFLKNRLLWPWREPERAIPKYRRSRCCRGGADVRSE